MKKLFSILAILSLALITANADEQGTVDNCASIIRDFRTMPEKRIPASVLRRAKGLAIMSVVKAGLDYKRSYTTQFVNKGVGVELRPKP